MMNFSTFKCLSHEKSSTASLALNILVYDILTPDSN